MSPAPADHPHTAPVNPAVPTNAGQGCLSNAGCHNAGKGLGVGAPEYSYAGTAYIDAAGTTPAAGATILITLAGQTTKLIVGDAGNFSISPVLVAAPTNTATANAAATSCPNTTPMVGSLVAGNGDCSSGGTCHGTGGTQGKIHLP